MMVHVFLAVLIQLPVALLFRSWLAGAAVATAWSVSREITQAEYRWIELYGHGLRENMPWWGAFDIRVWQKVDPWLDWMVPTALVFAFALIVRRKTSKARIGLRG
jgi:hypothetical protein